MTDVLPVTVVVPTIGRHKLVSACLASVARCRPRAAEVLVMDQSRGTAVRAAVARLADDERFRVLELSRRSKPRALNVALREAQNEIVLLTDDDCTVDVSWIAAAWAHLEADPRAIVTGRVVPVGDPEGVPSTIEDLDRRDYTGTLHYGALYGNNMACNRSRVLDLGGFDERFEAAEDNDLCYRWLRAGRPLRYEPDLLVWHHEWRASDEMRVLYRRYGHGQGLFYAKHLRRRDLHVVRFLARDLYRGARGVAVYALRRGGEWPDPRLGLLRGLASGLVEGIRTPRSRDSQDRGVVR